MVRKNLGVLYRKVPLGLMPGIAGPRLTKYLFEVLLSYCRQSLTNNNKTFWKFCVFSEILVMAPLGHFNLHGLRLIQMSENYL